MTKLKYNDKLQIIIKIKTAFFERSWWFVNCNELCSLCIYKKSIKVWLIGQT